MFNSLLRGFGRIAYLAIVGSILIAFTEAYPLWFGDIAAPLLRGFGICFVGLAAGDFSLRLLQPHIDTQVCYTEAIEDRNMAAGMIYLGRAVLMGIILFLVVTGARASNVVVMPPNAVKYVPLLLSEKTTYWNDLRLVSIMGAQIEQETCVSLKSKTCWSPNAELKTSRETGGGFGQITKAYNANGGIRFDVLQQLLNKYPNELKGYSWSNFKDPRLSMRAYVLMIRDTTRSIKNTSTQLDQFAFALSAFNGGSGGLRSDILSCRAKVNCNSTKWFGNVETSGLKSKMVLPGYGGQSPFSINRNYVSNVIKVRRVRYLTLDA